MKILFSFFIIIVLPIQVFCSIPINGFGVAAGYTNYNTFKGEAWIKHDFKFFKKNAEFKLGVNNRAYTLTFDNVNNLQANSIGIYTDVVVFPFNSGFYVGLRWELLNGNWVSTESKQKIQQTKGYSINDFYTGSCIIAQLGYAFMLNEKLNLRIFAQSGVQQFKISNGSSTTGSYNQASSNNIKTESNVTFIYDLNIGIGYNIK